MADGSPRVERYEMDGIPINIVECSKGVSFVIIEDVDGLQSTADLRALIHADILETVEHMSLKYIQEVSKRIQS